VRSNLFFMSFLKFQAIFLCALFLYLVYCHYTDIQSREFLATGITVGVFFGITYLFYLAKQLMYVLYGRIFSENGKYRLWRSNYDILSYLWGMSLYLPVLWSILQPNHLMDALLAFVIFYLLFRFTIIYMTIRIFYNKNTGLLYLSSYLCAQEIVPLLFLYEGLNYLYNAIEASTLWH
jgi:hypothetical protein